MICHRNRLSVPFFTMIEMLMVIVVLGILFAILLPKLLKSREYAKEVVCINNLKQIGQAYQNYMHEVESDDTPLIEYFFDDFAWVHPYVKESEGVFLCPSRVKSGETRNPWDAQGRLRDGDYMTSGTIQDVEKNFNFNNGHGNNPYHFDPRFGSNNQTKKIEDLVNAKDIKDKILYEKRYGNHFGRKFNVVYVKDLHYEFEKNGVTHYWTLDDRGWVEQSMDPFPY